MNRDLSRFSWSLHRLLRAGVMAAVCGMSAWLWKCDIETAVDSATFRQCCFIGGCPEWLSVVIAPSAADRCRPPVGIARAVRKWNAEASTPGLEM